MVLALVVCGLGACTHLNSVPESAPGNTHFAARVETTSTGLSLNGNPWWPSGFNAYQLGTDWAVNTGCGAEVDLDDYFAKLPPRALTRFNLYASFAVNKHTGGLDFGPLDAVFAAAKRHGQMVLPVLTGSSGDCENGVFKDRSWYAGGWLTTRAIGGMTYADWMSIAVRRWAAETSVAGWELVGEPETSTCSASGCDLSGRTCGSGAAQVLRDFLDSAGRRLRDIDRGHPVFAGFTGGDQCGTAGTDMDLVAQSPQIDVLDYHDYRNDEGVPPAGSDLSARIALAHRLGKPIVVNELGIRAGACRSTATRATELRIRFSDIRRAGVAGALLWAFVPDPRNDQCTYDIGYDDPAWRVVAGAIV
ncbi:beta-mannosidase [Gordonia sp. DT219]|uniref:beta-mannosidase n=1 Tax=Gordonia sp. DT219 TaxID=3416658 RepID=UPI003CEAF648